MIEEFPSHLQNYIPVAFDGDGSLVVATRAGGRDTLALHRFDPTAKKLGELLAAHPDVDLDGGIVYDARSERIVGVRYRGERPGTAWFDEEWARVAASVDRALPGRVNAIERGAGPNVLVFSYSDRDPGSYYLLDTEKRKLEASRRDARRHQARRDALAQAGAISRHATACPFRPGSPCRPHREAKSLPLVVLCPRRSVESGVGLAIGKDELPSSPQSRLCGAGAGVSRSPRAGITVLPRELQAVGTRDAGRSRRRRGLARQTGRGRP